MRRVESTSLEPRQLGHAAATWRPVGDSGDVRGPAHRSGRAGSTRLAERCDSVVGIVAAGDGEVATSVHDFLQLFSDLEER